MFQCSTPFMQIQFPELLPNGSSGLPADINSRNGFYLACMIICFGSYGKSQKIKSLWIVLDGYSPQVDNFGFLGVQCQATSGHALADFIQHITCLLYTSPSPRD